MPPLASHASLDSVALQSQTAMDSFRHPYPEGRGSVSPSTIGMVSLAVSFASSFVAGDVALVLLPPAEAAPDKEPTAIVTSFAVLVTFLAPETRVPAPSEPSICMRFLLRVSSLAATSSPSPSDEAPPVLVLLHPLWAMVSFAISTSSGGQLHSSV